MDTYLGHTAKYWLELQSRVDKLDYRVEDYIKEIAELRGQLDFIKSRIKEINEVVNIK